jgi:hypothetical protein
LEVAGAAALLVFFGRPTPPATRYARLVLRELRDVDYRTKTCSICGADGALALEQPCKDTGMEDYRIDQRVDPKHHPAAVKRMTEPKRRSYRDVGGELPGRKIDGTALGGRERESRCPAAISSSKRSHVPAT